MALNIKGALAAGYSPKDIVDLLAEEGRYNIASARQSGFSDDDILSTLQEGPTAGPLEALKGATKRLISSTRTGLAAPFDAEGAALAGLERQEAITERPAALSLEELKKLAETEGYFPAAKEAISSIPSAIASQIPYIAEMGAGALAGGAAAGPVGAVLGGIGLPAVTYLGSNVERQAAEQASQEAPIDINTGKAAAAAVGQAALDRFGLTLGGLGRIVGKAPLGTEAAERIAKESVLKATTKGAGRLAAAEIPTEVTQQMIERAQAGLPLTTQDALDEYKEVLYQTTLMSPLGSMARLQERSGAKFDVEQRDAQIAAEQARMRNMELSRIEQERLREEGIASEAIAAQKALAAEDAAKTANLLKMQQGDLGFGTTVEEVAARRGFAEPQQDLFYTPEEAARAAEYRPQAVEAPAISSLKELPSGRQILTPETIKSFGLRPNSLAGKALQQLDFSDPEAESRFDTILQNNQDKIKAEGEAAIELFKGELNDLRRATTTETAGESLDLFRAPDVPEPVAGAGSPVGYRVDGDRTDIAGPEVRAEAEPTPLTPEKRLRDLQEGETITSGGNVYRKTATGFEMVKPTEPAAQEVLSEETVRAMNVSVPSLKKEIASDQRKLNKMLDKYNLASDTVTREVLRNEIETVKDALQAKRRTLKVAREVTAEEREAYENEYAKKRLEKVQQTRKISEAEREGLQAAKEFEEAGWVDDDLSSINKLRDTTSTEDVLLEDLDKLSTLYDRIDNTLPIAQAMKNVNESVDRWVTGAKSGLFGRFAPGEIEATANGMRQDPLGYIDAFDLDQATIDALHVNAYGKLDGMSKEDIERAVDIIHTELNNEQSRNIRLRSGDYRAVVEERIANGTISTKAAPLFVAIQNNDINEVYSWIEKNAINKNYRLIARLLKRANINPAIKFGETSTETAIAHYDPRYDIVVVDVGNYLQETSSPQQMVASVLHEVMHSATVNKLGKAYFTMSEIAKGWTPTQSFDKKYINSAEYKAAKNLFATFDWLTANHPDIFTAKKHYGATDPFEMTAEIFVDLDLYKALEKIRLPVELVQSGSQNALFWVIKKLKQLLGIEAAPDSAIASIMRDTLTLASPRRPYAKRIEATETDIAGIKGVQAKYKTSDINVLKKPGFYEEPVTNTRLDTLYRQAGGKPIGQEVKPGVFNSIADDPAKYVAERRKEGSRFLDSIATNWFSSDAALQKAIRRGLASLGKDWDSVRNMLFQASTSQALHGEAVAHQFLEQGGIQYDPNTYKYVVSKGPASWKDLFDTVKVAAKNHNVNFAQMAAYAHQYMVARRLKGLSERNDMYEERAQQLEKQRDRNGAQAARDKIKVIHLTDEQIDAGMKLGQAIPELTQLAEQWNLVRKSVLDFAVDSGLYSREDADALADVMDYVPFYRVEQLEASAGPREFTRGLLDSAMDKAFKGSTQEVNDVFDNMERWTSYIIRKGINNRTAQNLVDVAFEAMPEDVQAVAKTARGMRENTISIWRDGELQKYEFSDPLYVKAFTGIESAAIPALKGWAKFADILRQNVVLNPLFSLSQLPQDAFGAMFSSGVEHPFSLPLQVMSEFYKTLAGTSSAHEALKSVGVVGTRDYSAQVSRIDAEISAGLKSPKALDKLLDPLRKLSMASDNAVRQAIYNQTMKETGDKAKAVERAFEVINFRRAGASREATILRQTIPFFGAYLQAMNVAAKVIGGEGIAPAQKAEARKILLSTMGKTFVLGLIYSAMIEDDEDYKKLDPTIRDHHLVIPGSGGLMIPIRPDVFTLFAKILPEHMYNLAYGAEDATKAKKALKEGLANAILGPTPMPQAVRPIFEVAANHDFYTGRPVVGKGMEQLAAEQQYSANTSELAKTIGSVTSTSPMNWDHLLKAYFGYTGGLALMATNSLIAAGAGRPLPDKSPQDMIASIPGMSTFVSKEFGGRDLSDYYELRDKVDEAVKTLNHHKTYGTREEAKAFLQENKQLISVKTQVNRINQNLSKIRQQERLIIESAMDPAEKQIKLRALNVRKHNMLKNIEALRLRAGL